MLLSLTIDYAKSINFTEDLFKYSLIFFYYTDNSSTWPSHCASGSPKFGAHFEHNTLVHCCVFFVSAILVAMIKFLFTLLKQNRFGKSG